MKALMRLFVIITAVLLISSCQTLNDDNNHWFNPPRQKSTSKTKNLPLRHEIERLADFNSIEIQGPYDVDIIFGNKQKINVTGNKEDMSHSQNYIKNRTLYIHVKPGEKIKARMLVSIHTKNLYRFKYKGSGSIKIIGINTPSLDVDINTSDKVYLSGKQIVLNKLRLARTGPKNSHSGYYKKTKSHNTQMLGSGSVLNMNSFN